VAVINFKALFNKASSSSELLQQHKKKKKLIEFSSDLKELRARRGTANAIKVKS
jgi:hypothetical protein